MNSQGIEVSILNYGGIIQHLRVPDREGRRQDVVAEGSFFLDGHTFKLARNEGYHHLHGGMNGFDKVYWDVQWFAHGF